MADPDTRSERADVLVGNWWSLVGTVLYLSEWVVIVAAAPPGPIGPSQPAASVLDAYTQHAGAATFSAAWFAVVLLGRVLFVAGLKAALRGRPVVRPLLDLALGAMAVSVVMEIVGYGIVAGTARFAAEGGGVEVVAALDSAAFWLILLIWGPIGVSVLASGLAMLRSGMFRAWLSWLPLVSGLAGIVGCLMAGASTDGTGVSVVVTSIAALGMWVWMIGTSVVLARRS